jgi:hypothetical protein
MILDARATATDVAFAVCTALARAGETAVLCGGTAAAYYVPDEYQSLDIDFIPYVGASRHAVDRALEALGYARASEGFYEHRALPYTIEFPIGPLAIGREEVTSWRTDRRRDQLLHVLTPADVVRDRFLHYWAWGDEGGLRVALAVARAFRRQIDLDAVRAWTEREMRADRSYDREHLARFFSLLG